MCIESNANGTYTPMTMYEKVLQEMKDQDYTFFSAYDKFESQRQIIVETEDENLALCYIFTKYGEFKKMNYLHTHYYMYLEIILRHNGKTGQFDDVYAQNGSYKAAVREKEE